MPSSGLGATVRRLLRWLRVLRRPGRMHSAARSLFQAAAPLLGKRGTESERRENLEHLRVHRLEDAGVGVPKATTEESKRARKFHTNKINKQ